MNKVMLLCFLISTLYVKSQQSVVGGVVSIHNSETETGKRRYVAKAQVEDDFEKATPTTTDDNGQFKLIYVGIKEKASVSFQVKKPGLQVVNTDALSAIAGQNDLVKISMAPPDKIAEYRRNIYDVGKTNAEERLQSLIQKKNKELGDLRKNSLQNATKIRLLEQELLQIEEQRKKIEEQARDLAKRYAPVNLDDASALFRDAFVLFQKGNLDSAQLLLKQADLPGKVESILFERKKIRNLQGELNKRDSLQKSSTQNTGNSLQLKADLHISRYEFDSASLCYELLIKLDSLNNNYIFNYAQFLAWHNQHDKAIYYFTQILKTAKRHFTENPIIFEPVLAATQNNLGGLYHKKNDYTKAGAAYNEALQITKQLAKNNPKIYEEQVASIKNNLGNLYIDKNDFIQAKAMYLEALQIINGLVKDNPRLYEQKLANIKNSLGTLYDEMNEFVPAESAYIESLAIYRRLATDNSQTYKPYIARLQNNLGNLYSEENNFVQSEAAFAEALQIREHLAKINPKAFEPDLAITQNNLGILYKDQKKFVQAEVAYLQALEIRRRFAKNNPQTYEPEIAMTLNNLGVLYSIIFDHDKKNFVKAEAILLEALQIRMRLAKENPQIYAPQIAMTQGNLGVLYSNKNDHTKAESAYLESLKIYKRFSIANPQIYEPYVVRTQNNLGKLYLAKKDYSKAEEAHLEALEINKRLVSSNPQTYEPSLSIVHNNLGVLYSAKKNYAKAETYLLKALETRKQLATVNPLAYEQMVAETQTNLGIVYLEITKYGEAENLLMQSLNIHLKLINEYPEVYSKKVNHSLHLLLMFYSIILKTLKYDAFRKSQGGGFESIENMLISESKKDWDISQKLAIYYSHKAWLLLFASKFNEAEQVVKKALAINLTNKYIQIYYAHSLLLQGKYENALKLYQDLKNLKNEHGKSYSFFCLEDLDELERNGVTNKEVNKIRAFLKER